MPTLDDAAVGARADALIAQMTSEVRVGQLTQYFHLQPIPAANAPALQALATTGIGSLLSSPIPSK